MNTTRLATALLLTFALSSCGLIDSGGEIHEASRINAPAADSAMNPDDPATDGHAEVNPPIVEPDLAAGLPLPDSNMRNASNPDAPRYEQGMNFLPDYSQNVAVSDEQALFTPDWAGGDAPFSGIAYALYELDTEGIADVERKLRLLFEGGSDGEDVWIAVADFEAGRWSWIGTATQIDTVIDHTEANLNADDNIVVAFAVAGTSPTLLYILRYGPTFVPEADLQLSETEGQAPLTITLDASGTTDVDNASFDFEFDLDNDGVFEIDNGSSPTYETTFYGPGTHTVAVRATDFEGASGTATAEYTIEPGWVRSIGSVESETGQYMVRDKEGNLYVYGSSSGYSHGSTDLMLAKFSEFGEFLWAKYWGSAVGELPRDMAVSPVGDVYVVGEYSDPDASSKSVFLVKFSPEGQVEHQVRWGNDTSNTGAAIVFDSKGDYYVVCKYRATSAPASEADILLKKFDSDDAELASKKIDVASQSGGMRLMVTDNDQLRIAFIRFFSTPEFAGLLGLVGLDNELNLKVEKSYGTDELFGIKGFFSDGTDGFYVLGNEDSGSKQVGFCTRLEEDGALDWHIAFDYVEFSTVDFTGGYLLNSADLIIGGTYSGPSQQGMVLTLDTDDGTRLAGFGVEGDLRTMNSILPGGIDALYFSGGGSSADIVQAEVPGTTSAVALTETNPTYVVSDETVAVTDLTFMDSEIVDPVLDTGAGSRDFIVSHFYPEVMEE